MTPLYWTLQTFKNYVPNGWDRIQIDMPLQNCGAMNESAADFVAEGL